MASLRKRGNVWYYRYTDADGVKRQRKGCTDRRVTEELARQAESEAAKIRSGLVAPKELAYRDHAVRPLVEHLGDWHKDLLAKGKTAKHADQYRDRAGRLIALVKGTRLADIDPGRKPEALERAARLLESVLSRAQFRDLSPESIQSSLAALRDHGRSNQTVNHYRAAVRAFLRWARDKSRIRDIPLRGVEAFNVDEDQRHPRRALTDDELGRLIRYAESGPARFHMPGPLRMMAYRAAAATGFRVEELRSLTPESFRLD